MHAVQGIWYIQTDDTTHNLFNLIINSREVLGLNSPFGTNLFFEVSCVTVHI
jgi:hypothetical protein